MKPNDTVYFVCCVNEKEFARKLTVISIDDNKVKTNDGTYDKSKLSITIPMVDGYELPVI